MRYIAAVLVGVAVASQILLFPDLRFPPHQWVKVLPMAPPPLMIAIIPPVAFLLYMVAVLVKASIWEWFISHWEFDLHPDDPEEDEKTP